MPSAVNLTLGKGVHLPSAWVKALGKHYFRNSVGTALDHMAGTCYLCRVLQTRHSAKANFTVCLRSSTRQKANLPSVKMLPSVFWITLGIFPDCRVLDFWHSAKRSALGNNRVSGSASGWGKSDTRSSCMRRQHNNAIMWSESWKADDDWTKQVITSERNLEVLVASYPS